MHKERRFALKRKKRFIRVAAILAPLLIALLLTQRVSAETTYVITDGGRVLVHTTTATDPRIVLGEAGLLLGADDTYTAQSTDGVSEINIQRRQKLTVYYYGEPMVVTGQGETVEELLTRLNLTWHDTDAISLPLDAPVREGMELTVDRVIRQDQIYTTVLPHETTYCVDATLPEGVQRIVTEGVDGEILCKATVTYINGEERERTVLSRQVVSQPVGEIIAVGSAAQEKPEKEGMAAIGERTITLPTGEVLTYTEKVTCLATAYHCEGYVGKTATGTRARVGAIAVDPEVFPYGTRFYIVTQDGEYIYGVATAEDCGSKEFIYGTRLDLFFNTKYECIQFGARNCDVYILG